jgi:hypothetical protein
MKPILAGLTALEDASELLAAAREQLGAWRELVARHHAGALMVALLLGRCWVRGETEAFDSSPRSWVEIEAP